MPRRVIFSKKMLEALRFDVSLVSSGEEAISELKMSEADNTPYRLVLVDWKMPGIDGIETARRIRADDQITTPIIVMVTAYGREEVFQQTDEVHLDGLLIKPVSPSVLLDSVMQAFGEEVSKLTCTATQQAAQLEEVTKLRGARILLVEDNEINQQLASEILTNAGILVSIADNGQEALDILKREYFDGVLMDIQMPVMDGYTATKKIRHCKKHQGLPILAMTANALVSERERSIKAGMNDHIAKPINVRQLFSTLAKWITPAEPSTRLITPLPIHGTSEPSLPDIEGLDTEVGLSIVQGDRCLYRKLLIKFQDNQRDFVRLFHEARNNVDNDAAIRCAHTLKGLAGSLGANDLQEAAYKLEQMCIANKGDDVIERQLGNVQRILAPLIVALNGLRSPESEAKRTMPEKQAIVKGKITPLLQQLRLLLEDSDTAAVDVLDQLSALPGMSRHENSLNIMSKYLDEYDFDEAITILSQLESDLEEKDYD